MIIVLTACSTSDKTTTEQNDEDGMQTSDTYEDTGNDVQMKLVSNCGFLSANDIAAECGAAVSTYKKGSEFGPCTFDFTDEDDNTISFIYYAYPATDNKDRIYSYTLSTGCEKVDDFVCLQEGSVYVFGDKYSLSLGNSLGTVCSDEQLKNLGVLMKKRIYGEE